MVLHCRGFHKNWRTKQWCYTVEDFTKTGEQSSGVTLETILGELGDKAMVLQLRGFQENSGTNQ